MNKSGVKCKISHLGKQFIELIALTASLLLAYLLSSMSLVGTHQTENIVITGELRIINPSIISDDK